MWMKSFTHISCQSNGLGTIFSFNRTVPPYLQYSKELFESWSCHTLLTRLQPSPIDTSGILDIGGYIYHMESELQKNYGKVRMERFEIGYWGKDWSFQKKLKLNDACLSFMYLFFRYSVQVQPLLGSLA